MVLTKRELAVAGCPRNSDARESWRRQRAPDKSVQPPIQGPTDNAYYKIVLLKVERKTKIIRTDYKKSLEINYREQQSKEKKRKIMNVIGKVSWRCKFSYQRIKWFFLFHWTYFWNLLNYGSQKRVLTTERATFGRKFEIKKIILLSSNIYWLHFLFSDSSYKNS